jgi:hypothetical protein
MFVLANHRGNGILGGYIITLARNLRGSNDGVNDVFLSFAALIASKQSHFLGFREQGRIPLVRYAVKSPDLGLKYRMSLSEILDLPD